MNPHDQSSGQSEPRHDLQPGQTVRPADSSMPTLPTPDPDGPVQVTPQQAAPTPPPQPVSAPPASAPANASAPTPQPHPAAPAPAAQDNASSQSFYRPDTYQTPLQDSYDPAPTDIRMQDNGREVVWSASEFIAHDKSSAWYLAMVGISVVIIAAVYFLTHDIMNTIVAFLAAVLFGIAAGRKPRQLEYAVDDQGVGIGRRFYPYKDFRSFSVADEGPFRYIVFMPLKRFMPPLNIYYDPQDEERIGDVLVDHLPFAEYQHTLTEQLMRRIRF